MELERSIKLNNKHGLHARASMMLSQLAEQYQAQVLIAKEGCDDAVDVKSILSLLTLGARSGQSMRLFVKGNDAEEAMKALIALIERNFDEH